MPHQPQHNQGTLTTVGSGITLPANMLMAVAKSITAPQVRGGQRTFDGQLPRQDFTWTFEQIRELRVQPTVVLARAAVSSILLAPTWSVKAVPKEEWPKRLGLSEDIVRAVDRYVAEYILPLRRIMKTAVEGCIDFGYAAFEKVIGYDNKTAVTYIKELKHLLPDFTTVLVNDTGQFRGLRNEVPGALGNKYRVELNCSKSLLMNIDVEGQNHYGRSLLANLLRAYQGWSAAANDLAAYHGKFSGSRFIVKYPPGKTEVDGVLVDNRILAKEVAQLLQNNMAVVMPHDITDAFSTSLSGEASRGNSWEVIVVGDLVGVQRSDYLAVMQYYDGLLVRGAGVPERSVLEAQFGTRADAEQHTDSFLTILQARLDWIMFQFNRYITNHMIRDNFGEDYEDIVYVEAAPLTDKALEFLRGLYTTYITATDRGQIDELNNIDMNVIRERVGVPEKDVTEDAFGDGKQSTTFFNDGIDLLKWAKGSAKQMSSESKISPLQFLA